MLLGKFTFEIDPKYLNGIPAGAFIGHSVTVGKVFLGNFRKRYTAKSISAEKYKSAYESCGSVSHQKADDYARNAAMTENTMRCIVPQYVVITAWWNGNGWQYAEPKDTDITADGDGVRITAKVIDHEKDFFTW